MTTTADFARRRAMEMIFEDEKDFISFNISISTVFLTGNKKDISNILENSRKIVTLIIFYFRLIINNYYIHNLLKINT